MTAEPGTQVVPDSPVVAQAAALRKRAAGPAPARFHKLEEGEHTTVALVVEDTPVEHYIAAARDPARFHKLAERHRPAAVARPVLLSKGPAEGRRVPFDRHPARWGLDRLALVRL